MAAHQDLMDAVAQKMTDLGAPTAELGFAPLQTSALQTSVFQQSRVPSQRGRAAFGWVLQYGQVARGVARTWRVARLRRDATGGDKFPLNFARRWRGVKRHCGELSQRLRTARNFQLRLRLRLVTVAGSPVPAAPREPTRPAGLFS